MLALGDTALDGYDDTFSKLTDVDMKFGVLLDEQGRERALTQSSFSSFLIKRDPDLRKRAFHQFYDEFKDHQYTLASSLAYSVKADVFRARARNFPSALEASLFRDDVPIAVYDGLISAVRNHLEPLFRYYDLRRRVLKLDELHHYDTYVPLVPQIETRISFDEAVETVLASLQPLGAQYVESLGEGLRGRWCDRYENKNKRSGAFSSGSYGAPPYILMNYKDEASARRLHARARSRPFHAHLVRAEIAIVSGLRLPDFSGRSGIDLQRGTAHASSPRENQRIPKCALI